MQFWLQSGVLKVLHGLLRILLHLLQSYSHHWVYHDCLNLRISHGSLHSLLIVPLIHTGRNFHLCILKPLFGTLILRFQFKHLLVLINGLMVLFNIEIDLSQSQKSLYIFRVQFQALLNFSLSVLVSHHFHKTGSQIVINLRIVRISLLSLFVLFDGQVKFGLLVKFISSTSVLFREIWVYVGQLLLFLLLSL